MDFHEFLNGRIHIACCVFAPFWHWKSSRKGLILQFVDMVLFDYTFRDVCNTEMLVSVENLGGFWPGSPQVIQTNDQHNVNFKENWHTIVFYALRLYCPGASPPSLADRLPFSPNLPSSHIQITDPTAGNGAIRLWWGGIPRGGAKGAISNRAQPLPNIVPIRRVSARTLTTWSEVKI